MAPDPPVCDFASRPAPRRSEIVGRHGDAWRVRVSAAPERGRANDELLELLARTLELPRPQLTLVSGATSRDKLVQLDGIDAAEAERRLLRSEDAG